MVDLISLVLNFSSLFLANQIVDLMPTWIEEGGGNTKVTEEDLIVGPDSDFSVAPNHEEFVVDHSPEGSIRRGIGDRGVQLKDLVVSEGEYKAWMDHSLALGVFARVIGGQVHVVDSLDYTD